MIAPEPCFSDQELAVIVDTRCAYLDGTDFRNTTDRQRAIGVVLALVRRFVFPNADVGTPDDEYETPPGGYHFIPERWVGPDEDVVSDVEAELTRRGLSISTVPAIDEIVDAVGSVDGVLRDRNDALMVYLRLSNT